MPPSLLDMDVYVWFVSNQREVVGRVVDREVVGGLELLWQVYRVSSSRPECRQQLLCGVQQEGGSQARQAVVRAASTALAWTQVSKADR